MNMPDVPLMSMLRQRMSWLNERQNVLSQNVANADTPGFTARDIQAIKFDDILQGSSGVLTPKLAALSTTNARHIAMKNSSGAESFSTFETPAMATSPTGNTVSLEDEMIKIADTQAQFQVATNLYSKAMNMMRTALGRGGV